MAAARHAWRGVARRGAAWRGVGGVDRDWPAVVAALAGRISNTATQIAVLFKPPVEPVDARSLLTDIESNTARLVALCDTVPVALGLAYRDQVRLAGAQLLAGLIDQLGSLLPEATERSHPVTGAVTTQVIAPYLQATGILWSAADTFAALPVSNVDAALHVWKSTVPVLDDAVDELKQRLALPTVPSLPRTSTDPSHTAGPNESGARGGGDDAEDDDFDDDDDDDDEDDDAESGYSETDKHTAQRGLKLMQALYVMAHTVVRKHVQAPRDRLLELDPLPADVVQWLDQLVTRINGLSGLLDNLAVCLDPPLDMAAVRAATVEAAQAAALWQELDQAAPEAMVAASSDRLAAARAMLVRLADELGKAVRDLAPDRAIR